MTKYSRFILLLLLESLACVAVSQSLPSQVTSNINSQLPNPIMPSPNVAALGKYGDYKVGNFTGVPDISIPIFEAKSGSLTVPITLSYHASGIKMTDIASWVGMGWSLSAGGQISRQIKGLPDEQSYLNTPIQQGPNTCSQYLYVGAIAAGGTDGDPDIFSYSYPGSQGGKFIVPYHESPYLIPAVPITIDPHGLQQFDITDEKGNLYRYGYGGSGIEGSGGAVSWYMNSMSAPNSDDQISFTYQTVGNATYNDITHSYTVPDQCDALDRPCPQFSNSPISHNVGNVMGQIGIRTIFFETGKVEFQMLSGQRSDDPGLKALDKITIYSLVNGGYAPVKTIQFNYSYFNDAAASSIPFALKLDNVQFKDVAGGLIQQYKFSYWTNSMPWDHTNVNYRNARDFWGFYNGKTQNTDLIMKQTIETQTLPSSPVDYISIGGALNRDVDTTYMRSGVLRKIEFPTGGNTVFDYETNQYMDVSPKYCGGVRVKKIISDDGTGKRNIKTFKYGTAESGYGAGNFAANQFNYMSTMYYYDPCYAEYFRLNYRVRTYFSASAFSLNAFETSPVLYPEVTEYDGDYHFPALLKGKTVFSYLVTPDAVDLVVPNTGKSYKPSFSWSRGQLTDKSVYGYDNNTQTFSIISSTSTLYQTLKASSKQVGIGAGEYLSGTFNCGTGDNSCIRPGGEQVPGQVYFTQAYIQSSGLLVPSTTTSKIYENGYPLKFVSATTTLTYDPIKAQVIKSETTRSNTSETAVTINNYAFQYSPSSSATGNARGIYMLNRKNIIALPIETYTYIKNSTGNRIVSGMLTTFKVNSLNAQYVVPDAVWGFETKDPLDLSTYTSTSVSATAVVMDSHYKSRITITSVDQYGNTLTASKTNGLQSSYQYGYGNALPVAAVKNAANNPATNTLEFLYENFEENSSAAIRVDATKAHTGYRYAVTPYVPTFVPPNGKNYTIEYWYLNGSNWQYKNVPYTVGNTSACVSCSMLKTQLTNYKAANPVADMSNIAALTPYFNTAFSQTFTTQQYQSALNYCQLNTSFLNANFTGYVSFGQQPQYVMNTGNFSIEAWVYLPAAGFYQMPILSNQKTLDCTPNNSGFVLTMTQGTVQFSFSDGSHYGIGNYTNSAITTGAWHHIVAIRNGFFASIYIDGQNQSLTSYSSQVNTGDIDANGTTDMKIGRTIQGCGAQEGYIGNIRQVRLYKRILSSNEVLTNYGAGYSADPSDQTSLVLWAPLDDGQGLTARDRSPYGQQGILNNSVAWVSEASPVQSGVTNAAILCPASTYMSINDGSAIDDIRIYPADALMKTYVYNPAVGITATIDEAGITTYYDYDNFGRLARVRNEKGNVVKQYQYSYKGN